MSAAVVSGAVAAVLSSQARTLPQRGEGAPRLARSHDWRRRTGAGSGALDLGAALGAPDAAECRSTAGPPRSTPASGDPTRTTPRRGLTSPTPGSQETSRPRRRHGRRSVGRPSSGHHAHGCSQCSLARWVRIEAEFNARSWAARVLGIRCVAGAFLGGQVLGRTLLGVRRVAGPFLGGPVLGAGRLAPGPLAPGRQTNGWHAPGPLGRGALAPGHARSLGSTPVLGSTLVGRRGLGSAFLGSTFVGHGLVGYEFMEYDQLICLTDCGAASSGPAPQPGRAVSTYTQQSPPVRRVVAGVCALGVASTLAALVLSMTRWSEYGNLTTDLLDPWRLRPWLWPSPPLGRWRTSGFAMVGRMRNSTSSRWSSLPRSSSSPPHGPPRHA